MKRKKNHKTRKLMAFQKNRKIPMVRTPPTTKLPTESSEPMNKPNIIGSIAGIADPIRRDLFLDWVIVLIKKEIGSDVKSLSTSFPDDDTRQQQFHISGNMHIKITVQKGGKSISIEAPEKYYAQCMNSSIQSLKLAAEGNVGEPTWWKINVASKGAIDDISMLHIMRTIGQHTRYQGVFKLGTNGYVKITQLGNVCKTSPLARCVHD